MRFIVYSLDEDMARPGDILGVPDLTKQEVEQAVKRRDLTSDNLRLRVTRSITISGWGGKTLGYLRKSIDNTSIVLYRKICEDVPVFTRSIPKKDLFNQPLPLP